MDKELSRRLVQSFPKSADGVRPFPAGCTLESCLCRQQTQKHIRICHAQSNDASPRDRLRIIMPRSE